MKKQRTYRAIWEDGHDWGEFTFTSSYRANSKNNLEDAYSIYRRLYSRSHNVTITQVYLIND